MKRIPANGDNPLQGALIAIAGIVIVAALLGPFRQDVSPALPLVLLLGSVILAGAYGGRVVGAVTGTVDVAFGMALFVDDAGSRAWNLEAIALLAVFVTTGVGSAWLAQFTERTEDEVEIVTGHKDHLSSRLVTVSVERAVLAEEAEDLAEREVHRVALLRSVSHDLRTPLSAIRAVATDLRDGVIYDTDTRTDLLSTMCDEVERLDQMVSNLLSMSRIEAGKLEPHPQAIDVGELVGERLRAMKALFHHRRLRMSFAEDLPLAEADYVMFQEILTNLLGNAARHAPDETDVWVVADKVVEEEGRRFVQVEVSDQGAGVPDELLPHLFEPFSTGPGSRSTGLGLAICRAMVEAHRGRIWVTRTFGGGATFCFTVPVFDDSAPGPGVEVST